LLQHAQQVVVAVARTMHFYLSQSDVHLSAQTHQQVVVVVGVSPFLREKEARFLVEVERAAGSFKVL
jgi:hypothetical protein